MQRVNAGQRFASMVNRFKLSKASCLVLATLLPLYFTPASQGQSKKNVLMIIEIGQSHPAPALVTNQILSALGSDPRFDAELHWENLDAIDISDDERNELRDGIVRKYRNLKLDLIVLVGPDPLLLFAEPSRTFYPGVPVVFCCSSPSQARPTEHRFPLHRLMVTVGPRQDAGCSHPFAARHPSGVRDRGPVQIRPRSHSAREGGAQFLRESA